jgi:nucleoredoxin
VESDTPGVVLRHIFEKELGVPADNIRILAGHPPRPIDDTLTLAQQELIEHIMLTIQIGEGGVALQGHGLPASASKTFVALGSGPITTKDRKGLTVDDLRQPGSYFALYFSAHWCPPCRAFTPELVSTYNKVVGAGKKFQVIFCSMDKDKSQFDEYYGTMPWATLPFQDSRVKMLAEEFGLKGIPTLVILDNNGAVVNLEGRAAVGGDPSGARFPWKK